MGWLFGKKKAAEFRLLDKRTASGGLVFWVKEIGSVRDERGVISSEFVNRMMLSEGKRAPTYWVIAMATSGAGTPLQIHVLPDSEGGCEVHVDHPAVTMSDSGKITVS